MAPCRPVGSTVHGKSKRFGPGAGAGTRSLVTGLTPDKMKADDRRMFFSFRGDKQLKHVVVNLLGRFVGVQQISGIPCVQTKSTWESRSSLERGNPLTLEESLLCVRKSSSWRRNAARVTSSGRSLSSLVTHQRSARILLTFPLQEMLVLPATSVLLAKAKLI